VGVLSVTAEPERAPLTTPIWYEYQPGGLVKVITAAGQRKVRLIEEAAGSRCARRWPLSMTTGTCQWRVR